MPNNEERAASAEATLRSLTPPHEDERDTFVDLLTNIMHARSVDWVEGALAIAKQHHEEEVV